MEAGRGGITGFRHGGVGVINRPMRGLAPHFHTMLKTTRGDGLSTHSPHPVPLSMTLRTLLAALLFVPFVAACDSTDVELPTITATVVADAQLSTLEQAVIEADLDDDLNGDGPFTVFAPTDAAFAAALEALDITAAELLARSDLAAILQLHVASGVFEAEDLSAGQTVTTLNGEVEIVATNGGLGIDVDADGQADARIVATDIEASNGVVHKIDAVLLPPSN